MGVCDKAWNAATAVGDMCRLGFAGCRELAKFVLELDQDYGNLSEQRRSPDAPQYQNFGIPFSGAVVRKAVGTRGYLAPLLDCEVYDFLDFRLPPP
jgi:hypothetical protein